MGLKIEPIPAFNDNYIWLLYTDDSRAAVVDPGDAAPVLKVLHERQLTLEAILVTHHHRDHTGGIDALTQVTRARVVGPQSDNIPQVTEAVGHGDNVTVLDTPFQVLEIPGHTLDHIAFYTDARTTGGKPALLCGDTLFAGGCGRLFEGTPAQMLASLEKLAALPEETEVYCAHEYTLNNLRFALAADPDNSDLTRRAREVDQLRAKGSITLPSTLALEKRTNPFLRCHLPALQQNLARSGHGSCTTTVDTFTALRAWKDRF